MLRLTVSTLLTVFSLLPGTSRAMRAGDILLFLWLGLNLPVIGLFLWRALEGYSVFYYFLEIVHNSLEVKSKGIKRW